MRFYGPRERKMGLLAFLRLGVWLSGVRAFRKGFIGNVLGEGFVLGGVFVVGRGQQVKRTAMKPTARTVFVKIFVFLK
uniref:Uncharacterized protein n=1 Tax=Kryptolebias marmoratus TaxID=37003 RepID=A0A3Q3F9R4_KRYMA